MLPRAHREKFTYRIASAFWSRAIGCCSVQDSETWIWATKCSPIFVSRRDQSRVPGCNLVDSKSLFVVTRVAILRVGKQHTCRYFRRTPAGAELRIVSTWKMDRRSSLDKCTCQSSCSTGHGTASQTPPQGYNARKDTPAIH
jgi:hypothetical protein